MSNETRYIRVTKADCLIPRGHGAYDHPVIAALDRELASGLKAGYMDDGKFVLFYQDRKIVYRGHWPEKVVVWDKVYGMGGKCGPFIYELELPGELWNSRPY
jgi:hypothetical protein